MNEQPNVSFWPLAGLELPPATVCFRGKSRRPRYLLEADPVYSGITNLIAHMLSPETYPKIERDAEDDHPADWCRAWKLVFKRAGRGNRQNYAEVDMKMLKIGLVSNREYRMVSRRKRRNRKRWTHLVLVYRRPTRHSQRRAKRFARLVGYFGKDKPRTGARKVG